MINKLKAKWDEMVSDIKTYIYQLNRTKQLNAQLNQLNTLLIKNPKIEQNPTQVNLRHKLIAQIATSEAWIANLKAQSKLISIIALFKK